MADRGFVADPAGFVQIEQGIIESHDALFAGAGHHALELLDPPLKDQLGHQRGVEQDLHRRNQPRLVLARQQALRNERLYVEGQIHQHLRPFLLGEKINDAIEGLIGIVGMQGSQA